MIESLKNIIFNFNPKKNKNARRQRSTSFETVTPNPEVNNARSYPFKYLGPMLPLELGKRYTDVFAEWMKARNLREQMKRKIKQAELLHPKNPVFIGVDLASQDSDFTIEHAPEEDEFIQPVAKKAKKPAAKKLAAKKPVEKPATKKPAAKKPAVKKPATKKKG